MKIPVTPPDFIKIIKEKHDLFSKAFNASITDEKGRYLHWDKLRHLTPPSDFTSEEWWAVIRFKRQNLFTKLPLFDKTGEPFKFCTPDAVNRDLHWLDMNAAGTVSANQPVTNQGMQNTYLIKSLVEEAINSSQLEGASTTRHVAKEMIRQGRDPKDKSEQMILNNYHAMQFIRDFKEDELTPSFLFELHRILTEKTLDCPDKAGVFRSENDKVYVSDRTSATVLHSPPHASQLNKRIETLCSFANDTSASTFIHPVIRAVTLHFMLAYDHPFVDGNGRTARALFYWSMISQGYWLSEFISISRIIKLAPVQYGRAFLFTETDDNDVTYFIIHQLEVIRKAIQDLHTYQEKKTKDIEDAQETLRNTRHLGGKLNFRQLAILRHALIHPRFIYNINEHRNSHGISYETARKDLLYMSDKLNLLNKLKEGRTFIFISPSDLEERIKKS
ncbi:MAG: Fic family protein [Desulfotignum sp.]|nr:Fic family protein [Desulfotignum sp.]